MKKLTIKKYPLLISLIVSCVIVVGSIFVLAFCGLRLSPSLGGGSQFEVIISDKANEKSCVQRIKDTLKDEKIQYASFTIEDNVDAGETATEFSQRRIIVKIFASDVSDEKELKIREAVSESTGVSVDKISSIENIISSIKSTDILLLGLGIGIIAICIFLFGMFRYNVFAGLAFLLAILHNLILFLSLVILTRLPLGLVSIAAIVVLSLVMLAVMVNIFEKYKIESEMHLAEKETPTSRLLKVEGKAVKPYIFVVGAVLIFSLLLLLVPVMDVTYSLVSIQLALIVTCYSTLLIGPGVFASFMDISHASANARLSRNDTINKEIKKKIAKSKKPPLK